MTFNPGVVGSNPTGPSTLLPYLCGPAKVAILLSPGFPIPESCPFADGVLDARISLGAEAPVTLAAKSHLASADATLLSFIFTNASLDEAPSC